MFINIAEWCRENRMEVARHSGSWHIALSPSFLFFPCNVAVTATHSHGNIQSKSTQLAENYFGDESTTCRPSVVLMYNGAIKSVGSHLNFSEEKMEGYLSGAKEDFV